MGRSDFSIEALYAALDAQRRARGLSWPQAARDINSQFGACSAKPISPSTLSGMRARDVVEGDGVLQMLLWLGRSAESFVPGLGDEAAADAVLCRPDSHQILRFDAKAMYAALDARRVERALTWTQIADEIGGIRAAGLTRLAKGGRVAFPPVMRIFSWLGRPSAEFTRASDW